jgi:hypothetical protein
MIKRLLGFLLFLLATTPAFSQIQKFNEDIATFLEQVEERFSNASDKKTGKEFAEFLGTFWNDPNTTDETKKLIITTCNQLAIKRARPYPDYHTYLTTFIAFYTSPHRNESFDTWHQAMVDLIKKERYPLRKIKLQLLIAKGLVEKNEIYSTPSVTWMSKSDNFKYHYTNEELSIHFESTDLTCLSKKDSIRIFNTSGIFYPYTEVWKGNQGKITWERAGFNADMVYATFDKYQVRFDKSDFEVDSVEFYNRHYFDFPLKGSVQHKVMVVNKPESSIYPKFSSVSERFNINQIHPNINYEGGFSQNGAKFLGSGTHESPAQISIFRNDTLFVTAKSLYFALRKDQILSNDTEISIQLDSGFVYHPGLIFKYMAENNEMLLIRDGEGLAQSPYFNTYHNISMDVELISWKLDEPWIDLRMITGAAENQAFFESLSYFREEFYNQLQGMDAIHPLQGLKNCSKYFRGQPFTAKDYSAYMGLPIPQIRQQVIGLSFFGFVGYNVNTDEIEIRERLNDYLLFRLGKKDYDVIRFNSLTPGVVSNARIDLKNYDLSMNGVSSISICDHQNVVFFPKNEKILLKKNRNFQFDGAINAGMLNLYGNGFKFTYDDFKIDMRNIDSLRMKVETGELDYFGQPLLKNVENTIAQLSGYLQIDEPDNKSGARQNPHFPILVSDTESFVHFSKKEIQDGVYDPENFFFTLEPFEMDSINTLKKRNFDFEGTFVSNIFPTFKENLTIRKDYSLGFRRQTPPEGYPLYGGKAHFTNTIDLSNGGLRGDGVLNYVTSTSESENFTFLPQQVTGQAHRFEVKKQIEGTKFPDVNAKYTFIDYYPEKEELFAQSQEENFTLFKEEAQLEGKLKITPYGLTGGGTFFMLHANLKSPKMNFSDHSVLADSSDFNLAGEGMQNVSFATTNLVSDIDFETRQGVFTSKSGGSRVDFTENRYISFISEFSWNMDLNEIYMGARGSKGNRFISVHRRQDSLDFYAPLALYDLQNKIIVAEEVKDINVADARIVLNNGIITIREDAAMDPLDSTIIELSDTAFQHRIYDARVSITGKYNYTGFGNYDYVNGDKKVQKLTFHSIESDKDTRRTKAEGTITNTDLFTFDSHFAYKGKVHLNAADKHLTFDGGTQLLHRCSNNGPQTYLRFNAPIDPNNIRIPVNEEAENFERNRIYKDFFITKDSTHVYSSFIEGRKDYSDIPIVTGNGYLVYNDKNKSFDIASLSKIENPDTTGTILRFSESDCNVLAEGELNMGINLDQVKMKASGSVIHQRDKNEILMSAMLGIDFFFNQEAQDLMYTTFLNSEVNASKLSSPTFIKRMAEWTGKEQAGKIDKARTMTGETNSLPADQHQMLLFSNIDLKWNSAKRCYMADGKADLAFIKQFSVNQQVTVKAEIMRKRSGNSIDLYIEADANNWFYFSYKNGTMHTLSSNPEYNKTVQALKAEDRKQKVKLGEKSFLFILSPESKRARFLKAFGSQEAEEEENDDQIPEDNEQ